MTQPWTPSLYRTHDVQTPAPALDTVGELIAAVRSCTARLRLQPYDPALWTERAACYLRLNYPELAVGDAYRAKLLFERIDAAGDDDGKSRGNALDHERQDTSDECRLKAYKTLGQGLYDCHCHQECLEFWLSLTQAKQFPHISRLAFTKANALKQLLAQKKRAAEPYGGTVQQQRDRVRDGSVVTVHYPWMEERHLARSAEVIACVDGELRGNVQPPACRVGKSTLAPMEEDMLGVFAVRPIRKGECILIDRTTTAACSRPPTTPHCENCYDSPLSSPIHASCCTALYCSRECYDVATKTYHRVLCGQDFTWLLTPASHLEDNASPMRPLLMLRFLALCIQAGTDTHPLDHPLDHPLIARLQPLANRNHLDVFTLGESVTAPIRILQQLGVDIFTTLDRFSTMVLHTLWTRLANNKAGSFDPQLGFVDAISPLLPLFNHSCEPNVEYQKEEGTSTIRFFALRDIAQGEEVFDSYRDVEDLEREERMKSLWPWFEGACLCARCVREAVV